MTILRMGKNKKSDQNEDLGLNKEDTVEEEEVRSLILRKRY